MNNTRLPGHAAALARSFLMMCICAVAACGSDKPSTPATGTAQSWVLEPGQLSAALPAPPSVQFSDGNRLSGFTGCGDFDGAYRRTGGNLYVSALNVADSGCANVEAHKAAAAEFVLSLEQAVGIEETAGDLHITSEATQVALRFSAQ